MALRVALVTPFAWSQPHDVNEHVAGLARELRARGHHVTVLGAVEPRRATSRAGRRALAARPRRRGVRRARPGGADLAAEPDGRAGRRPREPRRSRSRPGDFDIVHGFEPGLPSLSYLALRDAARADGRDVLLAGAALVSAGAHPARAPARAARRAARDERRDGRGGGRALPRPTTSSCRPASTSSASRPPRSGSWSCSSGARRSGRCSARSRASSRRSPTGSSCSCARARSARGRRCRARSAAACACARRSTAPPAPRSCAKRPSSCRPSTGIARVELEARAAGAAVASPPGRASQPELAAAEAARLVEDDAFRARRADEGRADAQGQSFDALATDVLGGLHGHHRRRRGPAPRAPLEDRDWIVVDLHMHTTWSHDCSIDVDELIDHAEAEGLGAIAVTDHNVFGGALEAVERARGRKLIVIPGEEVKTDGQGEVIGLFLTEEIPRGMSFAETVEAIRAQGGLVYVPHPFDRLHAIPDPATLHRHLAEIDVFEVYNARLLFEAYNDEALRFARKYNLTAGAGSDAHVLQGVGTGVVRMRRFEGPEEFLVSLRSAEVLRRPKSLAYLQGLKWVAQAKERVR